MLDRAALERRRSAAASATVRERVAVLRRRKGTIALTTAAAAGLAFGLSIVQTPLYASSVRLLLQPRAAESLFDSGTPSRLDPARAVRNEIVVIQSEPVRAAVRDRLGTAPPVVVIPIGDTDAIRVTVEHRDPDRAAEIANAYADAYITYRQKQAVTDLESAGTQVRTKVDDLSHQIDALDAQVANAPPEEQDARKASLAPQRQALVSTQALFKQQLDQIQVEVPLKSGGAQVIAAARPETKPVSPRPLRNAVLGFLAGLSLGVGLAFLRDHLDDSLKTKEDLEDAVPGRPVVGLVPLVTPRARKGQDAVVSLAEPTSPAAESFRTLRTAVQFLSLERPVRSLLVTSPNANEGKTTVVANLGVVLARAGFKVVTVGCDLRRPELHDRFDIPNTFGFTSLLLGETTAEDALQPVEGVDRLRVLSSGPTPPNPSELLSLRRTSELITNLAADGTILLLDSPPILAVTDALVLSQKVDAVLLVCAAGVTSRRDAERAVELLDQVDAPLVGTLLNGTVESGGYGYGYRYGYTYGDGRRAERRARGGRRRGEPARW